MAHLALPDIARPLRRVGGPLRFLTPAGRSVLVLAVAGVTLGLVAEFDELLLLGTLCTVVLVIALVVVRVPARVAARLQLRPTRTMAGETGAGLLEVTNVGTLPLSSTVVEVDLDPRVHQPPIAVRMPRLAPGATTVTEFVVPPLPRGVLRIGPARMRRTDPLGLAVSRATWAAPVDLFVRPRMVAIDPLGIGFVRDLEGTPSDEISMSDLAFHALREYVRGDDLRHVHWRSSARTGELHVRQYHDTRRSHVVVLVDERRTAYAGRAEFELAMSIAASVVVRFAQDDFALTFACGPEQVSGPTGQVLDACCLAAMAAHPLGRPARRRAPGRAPHPRGEPAGHRHRQPGRARARAAGAHRVRPRRTPSRPARRPDRRPAPTRRSCRGWSPCPSWSCCRGCSSPTPAGAGSEPPHRSAGLVGRRLHRRALPDRAARPGSRRTAVRGCGSPAVAPSLVGIGVAIAVVALGGGLELVVVGLVLAYVLGVRSGAGCAVGECVGAGDRHGIPAAHRHPPVDRRDRCGPVAGRAPLLGRGRAQRGTGDAVGVGGRAHRAGGGPALRGRRPLARRTGERAAARPGVRRGRAGLAAGAQRAGRRGRDRLGPQHPGHRRRRDGRGRSRGRDPRRRHLVGRRPRRRTWPAAGVRRLRGAHCPRRLPRLHPAPARRRPATSSRTSCCGSAAHRSAPGIRFAALDTYDGTHWAADNDTDPERVDDRFLRLSSTIDNPADGDRCRDRDHARATGGRCPGCRPPAASRASTFLGRGPGRRAEGRPALRPRHPDRDHHRRARAGRPSTSSTRCSPTTSVSERLRAVRPRSTTTSTRRSVPRPGRARLVDRCRVAGRRGAAGGRPAQARRAATATAPRQVRSSTPPGHSELRASARGSC